MPPVCLSIYLGGKCKKRKLCISKGACAECDKKWKRETEIILEHLSKEETCSSESFSVHSAYSLSLVRKISMWFKDLFFATDHVGLFILCITNIPTMMELFLAYVDMYVFRNFLQELIHLFAQNKPSHIISKISSEVHSVILTDFLRNLSKSFV